MSVNLITNNWNPWNDKNPHLRVSFPSDTQRGDDWFISYQLEIKEYCLVAKDKQAALNLASHLQQMAMTIRHMVDRENDSDSDTAE